MESWNRRPRFARNAGSRLICKEGVYHALAKGFVERAAPAQKITSI
ncbi:hypothetical protein [Bradyrhizobium sp. BRP56]|nr:hypothetical protein [Bradyrhizobium sp. BRP56]MCA1396622.1 hypothetical protein [Bradyrhizobium sp. BRP56]